MKTEKTHLYLVALSAILLLISMNVTANNHHEEQGNDYNKFSFTLNGGVFTGFTDIKEKPFFHHADELTFGGGLKLNYHMSPVFTLQGNFLYGELKGFDSAEQLNFENQFFEATLHGRLSINSLVIPNSSINERINFYGFAGAGLLAYRSRVFPDGSTTPIRYYGYNNNGLDKHDLKPELVIPFGIGVNFRLSERVDLGFETGFRYTTSDRLDAWPVTGSRKDMYNYTSVGFTFRLGRVAQSMDWAPVRQVMYPGDVRRVNRLADDVNNLRQGLDAQKDKHESDMESVRFTFSDQASKQEDLDKRTSDLEDAVTDLERRFHEIIVYLEDDKPETFYSVQVMALRKEATIAEAQKFLGTTHPLQQFYIDGWFKYLSGNFDNLEDALLHMQRLWGQGIRDAFVVIYQDGNIRPR